MKELDYLHLTTAQARAIVATFYSLKSKANNSASFKDIQNKLYHEELDEYVEGCNALITTKHLITDYSIRFYVFKREDEENCELSNMIGYTLKDGTEVTTFIDELHCLLDDFTPEQQKDFMESINLTLIENAIKDKCGYDISLNSNVYYNKRQERYEVSLESNELVNNSGIMALTLENLQITTFGSSYFYIDDRDSMQKFTCLRLNLSYSHKGGGSNGHSFATVAIDPRTHKYKIKFDGDDNTIELN